MTEHPLYPADVATSVERQALLDATVREVGSEETTKISLRQLAKAAAQTHQFARREFGDAESLIIEAAVLLARDALVAGELHPFASPAERVENMASAIMEQVTTHRAFFRAVFSGPLATRAGVRLDEVMQPMSQLSVEAASGGTTAEVDQHTTAFFGERSRQIMATWLTEPDNTETSEDIQRRIGRVADVLGTPKAKAKSGPKFND